jgi:hypothetical protein
MIKQRARATAVECGFIRHVVALPYTGEAGQPQGLPLPYTKAYYGLALIKEKLHGTTSSVCGKQ